MIPMCSTPYTMNLDNCNCLGTRNNIWSRYEKIGHEPIVCVNEFVTRTKMTRLKTLWKKINRQKKRRIFRSSSPVFLYDRCSYLQNFDDGYIDPDNFSRSLSARFATPPSKIFVKNIDLMDDRDMLEIDDES
ncbi:hypothetical protein MtrunA17_Chr4g0004411 [Medicago truncatula]|uniref:Uncharacterized protein n=1 Tax=Medicago truncatula TaxID=3880 RepID=A0A396I1K3_MEDTR|nr:hypothetical protein MtrunA17_Chr4g0004411 [Medicago truncatula]